MNHNAFMRNVLLLACGYCETQIMFLSPDGNIFISEPSGIKKDDERTLCLV